MGKQVTTVPFFDLGQQVRSYAPELHAALDEVIGSGYFIGGQVVDRFERDFADFIGVEHSVGTANGLDSIRLILEAYGVGAGDEVIVPAFTYYATWLGVTQTGATPVPVDVDYSTANLDPRLVEEAINERTKAILVVHLYGQAAELRALRAIANAHNILLIEDAAQSHGAESDAGMTGSVGDAAAFSFYPTKNLGALGDAGGVTTSDAEIADKIRSRRSYGQGQSKYDHVDTGWNSRLDPIQASFLRIHLARLPEWTLRRRHIASLYRQALGENADAVVGPSDVDASVWHHFVVRASDRVGFQAHMAAQGITTDVHYPYAVHEIEPMKPLMASRAKQQSFPAAELLARQVTSLPMGPWMNDSQVQMVVDALAAAPAEVFARESSAAE